MNRSYSHSFRPYASNGTKTKKDILHNSTISSGFRTVWKYRDTHSSCNKIKSNVYVKKQKTTQIEQQPNNNTYQTCAQQQMKQFIKMMKKNTDQRQQISKPTIQQTRNIQSSKSSRSIHSVTKSRCDSRLGTQFMENNNQLTLDELQKKIQQLIQLRLNKKRQVRTFFNCKVFQDDLDKQLNRLIKLVRGYQNGRNSQASQESGYGERERAIDNQIKEISQKINIIQTAIAESVTESQILKKFYSNKKKVRKQYAVLDPKKSTTILDQKNQTFASPRNQNPFLHFQTTNMTTFTKPQRNSYTKQSLRNTSYIINRQPLPRSNYQRQFLYYGIVPTYSCQKNKQNPMSISQNFSILQNKPTTYQVQFKEKKTNIIDSKTLDCRQDKFKDLKISFMPNKIIGWKNQPVTTTASIKKKNKRLDKQQKIQSQIQFDNKQNEQKSKNTTNHTNHTTDKKSMANIYYKQKQNELSHFKYINNMKTEHQSKFLGQKCTIQNFMKQKNLANLKYSYKFQYQA